ncbi:DUF4177 domain-containing protein [Sinanaerobacter chloroacetimidivorans]|jgi:hypothetical protein|uniref:DUF4177 domain-containing protein n=1 Tax=Sinanaerobacter chloroacetimidivorans TaxID=2818044 RepID=A0A8J8B218_9FIRM|nr:DUF4177 domain-containing protein [Sinanaerobacter chloroacetimidivorans]MBR0598824.1 DUF4177 domain-containing protein [Sinanaerobacter chloroacetimidivorans]
MEKWEYKTIVFDKNGLFKAKFDLDEKLNEQGEEGWELVAMVSPVSSSGMSVQMFATLKRKKK